MAQTGTVRLPVTPGDNAEQTALLRSIDAKLGQIIEIGHTGNALGSRLLELLAPLAHLKIPKVMLR